MDYPTAQASKTEQQSKEYLDRSIQMSARLREAYTYRGLSEIALGQLDTAKDDLRPAAAQRANEQVRKHIHELELRIGISSKNE